MTVAWIALALLLVALPVGAWWVGGRRFWSRLTPRREPDPYRELVRRHALTPSEAATVEGAVTWGRAVQDPRLRAAVADRGQSLQADAGERRAQHSRLRRVFLALVVAAVALAVAGLVREVLHEGWSALGDHVWTLLWVLLSGWFCRGPGRAIARNSGPPSTDRAGRP